MSDSGSLPEIGSFQWSKRQVKSGMGTLIPSFEWGSQLNDSLPMDGCDPRVCGTPDKHDPEMDPDDGVRSRTWDV